MTTQMRIEETNWHVKAELRENQSKPLFSQSLTQKGFLKLQEYHCQQRYPLQKQSRSSMTRIIILAWLWSSKEILIFILYSNISV